MSRFLRGLVYLSVFVLAVGVSRWDRGPIRHSWSVPLISEWRFLPDSFAAYSGQTYPPHMYYSNAGNQGTGLAPGASSADLEMTMPNDADEALVCSSNYQLWTNNSANSTQDTATFLAGIGVDNAQVHTSCPIWPYIGNHIFGPGASVNGIPSYAPANGFGYATENRVDAIIYNGGFGCGGGGSISSISTSGTCPGGTCAEVAHVADTSVYGVGDYIQVTGASTAADNSAPGKNFQITGLVANTSISFINSSAASCGANCGNIGFPYLQGTPPYQTLFGADGSTYPSLAASVRRLNTGSGNISWSMLAQLICGPMLACPYSNGCGLWSNSAGGPAFQ